MFKKISLNDNKVSRKKRNDLSVINQLNQFEYGLPEWQQDWTTINKIEQNFKNVSFMKNYRCLIPLINKHYLIGIFLSFI